jgi:hypothetical protein
MIRNNLWRKGNSPPTELPYRDYGPDLDGNIVPWDNLLNNTEGRAACDWQPAPDYPNYDSNLQYPEWHELGGWIIKDKPSPAAPKPIVSHKEFLDLLTFQEQVLFAYLQKQVEVMTPQEFGTNIIAQMVTVAISNFNASEKVELTNPQTIRFVNQLLVPAGILTQERANQVLANHPAPE